MLKQWKQWKDCFRINVKAYKRREVMEFTTDIFSQFDKKWALLTDADIERINATNPTVNKRKDMEVY